MKNIKSGLLLTLFKKKGGVREGVQEKGMESKKGIDLGN